MRVVTFAPSLTAEEQEGGGLTLKGFPMTSAFVDVFPAEVTIPIVLVVAALCGEDYDPVKYIVATSPQGDRLATMEFSWHWDDVPGGMVKFRVFAQYLPVVINNDGVYTLAVCDDPESGEADQTFPLPVFLNPSISAPMKFEGPRL